MKFSPWAHGRRGLAAGAVLAGVAGLAAGGLLAGSSGQPEQRATLSALSGSQPAPVPARTTPAPAATPVPASRPAPAATPVPARSRPSRAASAVPVPRAAPAGPEGAVIPAGVTDAAGRLVFYAVGIHLAALPGTHFGIMAGHLDPAGRLVPAVETNETAGPASAAGFHAVEAPMRAGSPAVAIPEFGYYAGPAARITGIAGGHRVRARTARWSRDPAIVIFWFPSAAGPARTAVQDLAAYDRAGHLLPAGHATVGHG
jgi:hypothetical protein